MIRLDPVENRSGLLSQLVWFLVWLVITGIGVMLNPSRHGHGTHQQLGLPPCPSVLLWSKPCPGCGLTTSWTATLHGRLVEALIAHPLGPALYAGFTFTAFVCLYGYARKLRWDTDGPGWNRLMVAVVVVFFTFGLVRMATTKVEVRYEEPVFKKITSRPTYRRSGSGTEIPVPGRS